MPYKKGAGGDPQKYNPSDGKYDESKKNPYRQNETYENILKMDAEKYRLSFGDKYTLTRQESIFLAKKKWDENVYCGMRMENRAVTFPQTKTILDGMSVSGVHISDVEAILNMRDAWRFLLKTIDDEISLEYACKLHSFIGRNEALEWGVLRKGTVSVGDYTPALPDAEAIQKELAGILESGSSVTSKALDIFLMFSRGQFFWDGNKRTALTMANKLLVQNGAGMLIIPEGKMEDFNTRLIDFYKTGNGENLKLFLYENAIVGIDYE